MRVAPYLFLFPSMAIVAAVSFLPIYFAVQISFYHTEFYQRGAFIGFQQYLELIRNPDFLRSVLTSIKYCLGCLALTLPMGMLFAVLLNRPVLFRGVFRTILIVPWAVSQSVTAMLWVWLLNPTAGPVKYILARLGINGAFFLSSPDWAIVTLIFVNSWMCYPFPMVLFLAALQTVPRELDESARIDGSSTWMSFWRVTLPFIRSTVMTTSIILTLQFFNMVTLIFVLTGGGPLGATRTISLQVFQDGFINFRVGAAAAAGMIIFLLNLLFSLSYIRVLRREEMY